jgi:hypothetical protein
MDKLIDRLCSVWYAIVLVTVAALLLAGSVVVGTHKIHNTYPWDGTQVVNHGR